jgi:hypothetical protein
MSQLNINARESRELIASVQAQKTAAVKGRFVKMAQLSVSAEAARTNEKLAAEHIDNVKGTNLPGAMAVAVMMAKCSSEDEGPVIAENAQKLAGGK